MQPCIMTGGSYHIVFINRTRRNLKVTQRTNRTNGMICTIKEDESRGWSAMCVHTYSAFPFFITDRFSEEFMVVKSQEERPKWVRSVWEVWGHQYFPVQYSAHAKARCKSPAHSHLDIRPQRVYVYVTDRVRSLDALCANVIVDHVKHSADMDKLELPRTLTQELKALHDYTKGNKERATDTYYDFCPVVHIVARIRNTAIVCTHSD